MAGFGDCRRAWSMIAWMLERSESDLQTPKPVVRPGLDHNHRHRLPQQPVYPASGARGRLTAHPGVHRLEAQPFGVDFR